jgi:enolase
VGDEGGFAPNLFTNMDALDTLSEAVSSTSYKMYRDVFLGLDIASSYFYKDSKYNIKDQAGALSTEEMLSFYTKLISQRQLIYLEDAFSEDDWQGWKMLTANFGKDTLIVGDDLVATNPNRLKQAIEDKAINAVLIKPNQIGTLSETLEVIKQAKEAGLKTIVSHRSGETNDTLIADLAVGTTANYIKFGAPARGERVAKYNRLLEIEEELQPLFKE